MVDLPEPVGPVTRIRPFLSSGNFFKHRRQTQFIDGQNLGRDQAEDSGNTVFLLEKIRAITRHPRHLVTEVDIGRFFEDFDFSLRRDLIDHRLEVVVLQRLDNRLAPVRR